VTTLDELTAAVEGDDAKIVLIDGTITGDAVVKVGANTSVLGNAGASKSALLKKRPILHSLLLFS
jgi:pectate lyase